MTVNATGCRFDSHWRKLNIIYFNFFAMASRHSEALSFATQHIKPPENGGKLGTECKLVKRQVTLKKNVDAGFTW